MGWLPQASRRDVGAPAKYSNGPMRKHLGVLIHVNDSQGDQVTSVSGDSLYNWITGNHGMSCHYQFPQTGRPEQYIDTRYSSWCHRDANDLYISYEFEGLPSNPMTEDQIHWASVALAFDAQEWGFPLQLANKGGELGLGYHGMDPSYGHPACPGEIRKAQRPEIVRRARLIVNPQEDDMAYTDWSAKDRQALAADVVKALLDRPMGGVGYPGDYAHMLKATLDAARVARVNKVELAAMIRAELASLPPGAQVNADAIATAVVDTISEKLGQS